MCDHKAMMWALKVKNILQFVDGKILKTDRDYALLLAWDKYNAYFLSQITHSLYDEIKKSVLWMNVALDVWKELRKKCYEGNLRKITQL